MCFVGVKAAGTEARSGNAGEEGTSGYAWMAIGGRSDTRSLRFRFEDST